MTEVFKVAGVQMDVKLGEVEQNVDHIIEQLRIAVSQGAQLTVFPECATSGYCFESFEEALPAAQTIPGPVTERLQAVCQELNTHLVTGILEQDGDKLFNTSILLGPHGLIGKYRKIHLPYLGLDCFATPGNLPPQVWTCNDVRIGMHICYDGSFPESARCMALDGADLVVLPTNWPPGSEAQVKCLAISRASENHIYFMAVNRAGEERGFRFVGHSSIADPRGNVLAEIVEEEPGIFYAEIDPQIPRNKHLVRVPKKHEIDRLADRRPDLYARLVAPSDQLPLSIRRRGIEVSPYAGTLESSDRQLHQQMWAPWRLAYITSNVECETDAIPSVDEVITQSKKTKLKETKSNEITEKAPFDFILAAAESNEDRENLVIDRTENTITMLNKYPYNNGHLLVAPKAQKAKLTELTEQEQLECIQQITKMSVLLEDVMNVDGINVGLNLGKAAGAGLPSHLHWHLVPRWNGDTNFMPVFSGVKVIPQSLDALWQILTKALQQANQ